MRISHTHTLTHTRIQSLSLSLSHTHTKDPFVRSARHVHLIAVVEAKAKLYFFCRKSTVFFACRKSMHEARKPQLTSSSRLEKSDHNNNNNINNNISNNLRWDTNVSSWRMAKETKNLTLMHSLTLSFLFFVLIVFSSFYSPTHQLKVNDPKKLS